MIKFSLKICSWFLPSLLLLAVSSTGLATAVGTLPPSGAAGDVLLEVLGQ
jgi:hypothetical protein